MNSGFSKPHSPEISPIEMDIAKYILSKPRFIFKEYQKLLEALKKTGKYTKRKVSIIYRREVADTKSPQYIPNLSSTTWLVNNYQDSVKSVAELTTIVKSLSGLSSAESSDEPSEEAEGGFVAVNTVDQLQSDTKAGVTEQLQTGTRIPKNKTPEPNNDASLWVAKHSSN